MHRATISHFKIADTERHSQNDKMGRANLFEDTTQQHESEQRETFSSPK